MKGFSASNIRNMRQFFEEWKEVVFIRPVMDEAIQQPLAVELQSTEFETNIIQQPLAGEIQKVVVEELDKSLQPAELDFVHDRVDIVLAYGFLSISFTHHMEILFKTDNLEQRLFYIQKTFENKWDKYTLRELLKQDLYHHQSLLPNNFMQTLPQHSQALKAIGMFKDSYLLDYINVEELNVRDKSEVDEKVVEQAIVHNIKNFIMTFGKDFAFVGNQYHLEKFGEHEYVDLLFYNRELSCLVAVELKMGKFKPIYLAQLQTYLQVLDAEIRKPNENPSIGIILCREVNRAYVEFVIQKYDSPMGVATYTTSTEMPENLRKALPDIEYLKSLISGDEGLTI